MFFEALCFPINVRRIYFLVERLLSEQHSVLTAGVILEPRITPELPEVHLHRDLHLRLLQRGHRQQVDGESHHHRLPANLRSE